MIGRLEASRINRQINDINRQITNTQNLIERLNQLVQPLDRVPENLEIAARNIQDCFTINNNPGDGGELNNISNVISGTSQRIRNQAIPELRRHIDRLRLDRERLNAELLALGGN